MRADYAAVFVDCADHARGGRADPGAFSRAGRQHRPPSLEQRASPRSTSSTAARRRPARSWPACSSTPGSPSTPTTAQALFTGIMTDTGQFRFTSTTRARFCSRRNWSPAAPHPTEAGYRALRARDDRASCSCSSGSSPRCAWSATAASASARCRTASSRQPGPTAEDTEGLVDYARCIDGVDVGVLIEERPDGAVKASLRAKDPRLPARPRRRAVQRRRPRLRRGAQR